MSKLSRTKGHGFERACAKKLRAVFPDCKRHLEMQKEEALGFDLDNTGPFRFQCKAYKKYAPVGKIEEVILEEGVIPALITKGDSKKPVVCLYLDDFVKVIEQSSFFEDICEGDF